MNFDIIPLKRKMLVKYPFFGSVVASVKYKEKRDIPTACTDGETIYYNPDFLKSLSVDEQTFLFAHEVCHIAFNHILRSEGKDASIWNLATDGVINQYLLRDGLKMVEGAVDMAEALNYDAEELYEKLIKEKKQQQNGQSYDSAGGESGNEKMESHSQSDTSSKESQGQDGKTSEESQNDEVKDVGHDSHSMWGEAVKKHKEEQKHSEKKKSADSEIEKKQEELDNIGEKDAFKKNLEEKRRELEELKKSISRGISQAGTMTNSSVRSVSDIGTSKPIIDWRYMLREATKYELDWSYKNAEIEYGVVVPKLEEQMIPETEILLDTSGSINELLLKNFLRECKNILLYSKLKVGCFDTEFYGFHDIRTLKDIETLPLKGGGGTDFNVAVSSFSRRVDNKIIFTDGEGTEPKMPLDVIWIVFGRRRFNPEGGTVIQMTPEQLERLYSFEIERSNRKI